MSVKRGNAKEAKRIRNNSDRRYEESSPAIKAASAIKGKGKVLKKGERVHDDIDQESKESNHDDSNQEFEESSRDDSDQDRILMPAYLKAFSPGCFLPGSDPGPFIGRALVWKLQVGAHLDGFEAGPVATTFEGSFRGRGLVFPDSARYMDGQPLKFRYLPGDLCYCFAGALYHGVQEWDALAVDEGDAVDNITPG
ncbi:hypothetical protein B0H11DRAFT_1912959 [Mycena galericulata]|nr:hypothetical protein B0H11DRAFT_1912959 [Mycena galericulata]